MDAFDLMVLRRKLGKLTDAQLEQLHDELDDLGWEAIADDDEKYWTLDIARELCIVRCLHSPVRF